MHNTATAARGADALMNGPRWGFTSPRLPRHVRGDEYLTGLIAKVSRRAAELAASPHYTDAGRRAAFTDDDLRVTVFELDERRKKAEQKLAQIAKERAELLTEALPPAASLAEQLTILEYARAARENPSVKESFLHRLLNGTPSPLERRMQVAFLNTLPELFGLVDSSYHDTVARRVQPHLGEKGEALDEAEVLASEELDALKSVKMAILASADRAQLAEAGLATKPPAEMSEAERRAFIDKHGHAAWRQLVVDEHQYGASLVLDDAAPALDLSAGA